MPDRQHIPTDLLRTALSRLLGELPDEVFEDVASRLDWVELPGRSYLFRQGDEGDSMFVLVSGRLRAVLEGDDGDERVLGEIGRGETVGEIALVTGDPRTASIRAVRDSVLCGIRRQAFLDIVDRHPRLAINLAHMVIDRLRERTSDHRSEPLGAFNLAVVPVGERVDAEAFCAGFVAELGRAGSSLWLSSTRLDELAPSLRSRGRSSSDGEENANARLLAWLDERETEHRWMLYQADRELTPWSSRALRQADVVLLVAHADDAPALGRLEGRIFEKESPVAEIDRHLVLLHERSTEEPSGTARWLEERPVRNVFHLKRGSGQDLARLARTLTGRGLGLVLGGGAARGFAHVGVFRALEELGIAVDTVGGSSIGASVAAVIARGWDSDRLYAEGRRAFLEENPFSDYTLPMISVLKGRKLEELMRYYHPGDIEDLWLPFFCVSSNMSNAGLVIYERGPASKAVRASVALPGVFPPAVDGNHLLIDGGVLNNLPVDIMRRRSDGPI
ncbi:MAG: cyclic nucleotide-binding domain-containing protein, partial [Thermoanaerobaculia bacterium]|nr:cyclic nucleotide-binding domain-containing protein [Thermoanaerobaculia bacterium]